MTKINNISLRERLTPPLWIFSISLLVCVVWLLLELREIVSLLVVGYAIAYVIDPALSLLQRLRISRQIGVFVLIGIAAIVLSLVTMTALPTISEQYQTLSANFPQYLNSARDHIHRLLKDNNIPESLGIADILSHIPTPNSESVSNIMGTLGKALLQGYSITLTIINLALLPFIVYYLSVDFRSMHENALQLLRSQYRKRVKEIALEINHYVAAFVRGQFLVGCILTVMYSIGLGAVLGLQLWVLLSLIAGLGNMIPYFGFLSGIILSSIMALVTYGDFTHLAYVWITFAIVHLIENTFIVPKVVGDKVGLSPLVVILALFAGGKLFGILGLFLAIPVTAGLRVLTKHTIQNVVHS